MSIFYEGEVDGDCYGTKCTKSGSVEDRDELYTNPSEYHTLDSLSGFGVYKEYTSIFHDEVIRY